MYYLYSALSGSVEIGMVCWAVTNGLSPAAIVALGMAYQLGNMIPVPYRPAKRDVIWGFGVCLFSIASLRWNRNYFPAIFLLTAFLSAILQSIRTGCSGEAVRWKKRLCRVMGFASACLYRDYLVICLIIVLMLLAVGLKKIPDNERRFLVPKGNRTMILHQMHYFCYSYGMLYLSYVLFESMPLTIGSFVISWLTYLAVEPFLKKYGGGNRKKTLCLGHLGLCILLLGLFVAIIYESWIFAVLWCLSGLGGGTVFCIYMVEEQKQKGEITQQDWSWSENIGHVLGCLLALLWIGVTGFVEGTIVLAGMLALITVWSACRKG